MMSVDEARAQIIGSIAPLPTEILPLEQAWGRVIAKPAYAQRTHPAHDVSAMDGYAVRSADVTDLPTTLEVIEEIPAGHVPTKALAKGQTSRIFTGASLPDGADTIVLQEDTARLSETEVDVKAIEPERHVRKRGLDFEEGTLCVDAGTRLASAHVGLLAAANVPSVYVHQRPVIAFLSTGSELVAHGMQPGPGQIISSNGIMLSALAHAMGAQALDLGAVEDDITAIQDRARGFDRADIAVTIGGASVGDHDLIQPALTPKGLEVDFWKVAMRPGKPLIHGRFGATPFLGLPGNPVSAYVCALLFLRPMVEAMMGLSPSAPLLPDGQKRVTQALPKNGPRMTFMRAKLGGDGGDWVTPNPVQDSSALSAVAAADCLIIRPPQAEALKENELVSILSLKGT